MRNELYDADYLDKLNPEEREWYNKFMSEYVNASVKKDKKTGRVKAGHLHKNKALAKDVYDANNRRNNDVFGVTKVNGLLTYDIVNYVKTDDGWYVHNPELTEDELISKLDEKRRLQKSSK